MKKRTGGLALVVVLACAAPSLGQVTPGVITLEPTIAVNEPGTDHTITATVLEGGAPHDPIVGALVTFEVLSGPNAGEIAVATTDATGVASFLYTGAGGPGVDSIIASFFDPFAQVFVESDIALKFWDADCNGNGVADTCDLDCGGFGGDCGAFEDCGGSADCNGNGIPDDCETDCNGNGVPDDCDIASGTSPDCNGNGVPDECDVAGGTSDDCNSNGVPDECDEDCNTNGTPDDCEAFDDCNSN
ncbi:MAG: hypothetical protein ACYSTY_04105, partial [Planctomycetota bacterium]